MTVVDYAYPGNVRELENILERTYRQCVEERCCPAISSCQPTWSHWRGGSRDGEALDDHMNRIERRLILEALAKTGFNRTAAAKIAGRDLSIPALPYRRAPGD